MSWRVDSGVILGHILGHSGPYSRPILRNLKNCLHLAVGRALSQEYGKYGSWEGRRVVPGIAPSQPTHPPTTPGTPPPALWLPVRRAGSDMQQRVVVGLRSVGQLTLRL